MRLLYQENWLGSIRIFFALDSMELGTIELVTHSIDTGDNHSIHQPLRMILFALQYTMEEMVQKMLAQGVIQNSVPGLTQWF